MLGNRIRRRFVGVLLMPMVFFIGVAPRVNAQECVEFLCELTNPNPDKEIPAEVVVLIRFPAGVPELQPGESQELPESAWTNVSPLPFVGPDAVFRVQRAVEGGFFSSGGLLVSACNPSEFEPGCGFNPILVIELETTDGSPNEWFGCVLNAGCFPQGPATITKQPCAKQVPLSPYPLAVALLLTGGLVLARRRKRPQSSSS